MDIDSLLWPTLGQGLVRAVRFCLEVVGWFVVWMVLCFLLLAGALAAWKRGRTRAVPEGSFLRDLIRLPGSRRDEPGRRATPTGTFTLALLPAVSWVA